MYFAIAAPIQTTQETTEVSMSFFKMMANASPVVQLVLLLLGGLSVLTWATIFSKWGVIRRSMASNEEFLDVFWSGKSMDFIYSEAKKFGLCPVARIFQAGYVELQRLIERDSGSKQKDEMVKIPTSEIAMGNLERSLSKAFRVELVRLERSLPFLATTGSAAPFIGLFGTVWGIMNSFHNIGVKGGASLAVVAPGIAEALVATAVGLAAAIPAVVGYNYYANRLRSLKAMMENFSGDFLNIAKRNFLMN